MRIGEAADQSGVSAKMIRYYESVDLIPAPRRSASGYRNYTVEDVHMLRFIRRARDLGFMVEDIAELLSLWRDGSRRSADVKRLALDHVARLQKKVADIGVMVDTLTELAESCHGDDRAECPILGDLEDPKTARSPRTSAPFGIHGPKAQASFTSIVGGGSREEARKRGKK